MNEAICIRGLTKSYGSQTVLKNLTFTVKKGEIFALLGKNGAGKTTALACIEGLRTYEGEITVNGKMGIQLQSALLPAHIKPMEAIRLFSGWRGEKTDKEMLKKLGISEMGKKQYQQLSVGQKRRLYLALALTGEPDIVILDEPTAGLDVEGRVSLHEQIRALKEEGKTVILASHDMAEVESLCDRIAILDRGILTFLGTTDELTATVGKRYTIRVKTSRGEEQFETDKIEDTMFGLLKEYQTNQIELLDLKIDRGTLEQHFLEFAKGGEQ